MATETNTPELKNFLSIYDYLGKKAAGPALGLAVAKYATRLKEPQGPKNEVDVSSYKGLVSTYRPAFLDFFFTQDVNKAVIEADIEAFKAYKAKQAGKQ